MAHKSRSHAILSASSSHRWLNCPPSAKLNAERSAVVSEYAKEGTCAHELAEYKLRKALGQSDKELHEITENLDFFDSEMDDCTDSYADFVMEQFENAKKICPDTLILIEQKLDFSEYVPGGFGTGDCVIVADGTLQIIDFRFGVLAIYRDLYDIEKVSDWEISVPELLDLVKNGYLCILHNQFSESAVFVPKIKCFLEMFCSVFRLKSIFCELLCKIMKKVVQIVKNKNFLCEIESCPLKNGHLCILHN